MGPAGSKSFHRYSIQAAAIVALWVVLSGAASAQITCPVTTNTSISSTVDNTASTCVINSGVTLSIASGGSLENIGPTLNSNAVVINDGTLTVNGEFANQDFTFLGSGTLTNFGTVFNNNVIQGGTVTNAAIFDNFGSLGAPFFPVQLNNAGILTNAGTISVNGVTGGTNAAGATINNTGSLDAPNFTNNGRLENFSGGTLSIVSIDSVTFTNSATLINDAGGTINISSQFENEAGASVTNNGSITVSGFSLDNFGTFTNNGHLSTANPLGLIANPGTLNNYGTIDLNGSGMQSVGSILNAAGATFNTDSSGILLQGTLDNRGAISITGTGGINIDPGGALINEAGSSYVQTAGFTNVNGTLTTIPTVQIQGGVLAGNFTINGAVNNSGGNVQPGEAFPFEVPGTLTENGDYTQGSSGTLTIELGGSAPGDFSVLDVSGLASLDGTIDFDAINGFMPSAGDDFTFLLFDSLSGNFSSLDVTNWLCPTVDTCSIVTGAHSMSLDITGPSGGGGGGTTTPEPASLILLGTGFIWIALGGRKLRRSIAIALEAGLR
jgi:hypothetical protein